MVELQKKISIKSFSTCYQNFKEKKYSNISNILQQTYVK